MEQRNDIGEWYRVTKTTTRVQDDTKDQLQGGEAESPEGTALQVDGKSSFSTVGSGTIGAGKDSFDVYVNTGLVTDESHISVTLTSKPKKKGQPVAVSFIGRDPPNNRFEVHLTDPVDLETTFTYFIVEP